MVQEQYGSPCRDLPSAFPLLNVASGPVLYPGRNKTEELSGVSELRFETDLNMKSNPLGIKPKISSCLQ